MRRTPPAYIDIIVWLKDHGHAATSGAARRLILAKRLRSESHVIGRIEGRTPDGEDITVVERFQPAALRKTLHVVE